MNLKQNTTLMCIIPLKVHDAMWKPLKIDSKREEK